MVSKDTEFATPTSRRKRVKPDPEEFAGVEEIVSKLEENDAPESENLQEKRDRIAVEAEEARKHYENLLAELDDVTQRVEADENAPGYWRAFAGRGGYVNVFAWLGLIFSFAFFPLGFLFGGLGIINARAVPSDNWGKIISWVSVIVSTIAIIVVIFGLLGTIVGSLFNLGYWSYAPRPIGGLYY